MELIESKIDKIINIAATYIPDEFGCGDDDDEIYNFDWDGLWDELIRIDSGIQMEHGVSKMVIIPSFSDKVIKIPFNGNWYFEYPYDEETEETLYDEEPEEYFEKFGNGGYDERNGEYCDYCAREVDLYYQALESNMQPFFAETEFYKEVNGTKFYLQEKISGRDYSQYSYSSSSETSNSYNLAKELSKKAYGIRDTFWLAQVIEYYGEIVAEFFVNFIEETGINDLHSGNVSFRENGEPVIYDYSGWAH